MLHLSPEDILEDRELRVLFWRSIWSMPADLRRVITHLYICDRPVGEVVSLLGMNKNNINLLHLKAIEDLKERVKLWR